ncbi:MAG: thiamine pyrophosphate-binding protein, partial [Actinomycetota bacterium]|nr:thiamine pyrophosphate-binding protein [Actinomycetota bacterium]
MSVELPVPSEAGAVFGSDAVVDLLRAMGVKYVPLNPGSSFRGLHDSLVNHGGNRDPQLLLCLHEEIAVSLAHGYAKATGGLAVAAVHDLVGLMHASMAVYDAFCDRTPVLVLGGSGPMDPAQRRPIDWVHSATTQAQLVRDYVVWDAEPATPAACVADVVRACQRALSAPRGPAYVSLDAGVQEVELPARLPLPDLALHAPA